MSEPNDGGPGTTQRGGGNQPGGQPRGRPQTGQPPAGQGPQPQGASQAPPHGGYRAGPGPGDILNIPETKNELKVGIVLNLLLSVGLAVAGLGVSTISGFAPGFGGLGTAMSVPTSGALLLSPLVGVLLGLRQADVLEDQPDTLVYTNAGATAGIGAFALLVVSLFLAVVIAGASAGLGNALGQLMLPYVITAVGAGLVAAGAAWTERNLLPGPARANAPRQNRPR